MYLSCHRLDVIRVWKPTIIFVMLLNHYLRIFHNDVYNLKHCIIDIKIAEYFQ